MLKLDHRLAATFLACINMSDRSTTYDLKVTSVEDVERFIALVKSRKIPPTHEKAFVRQVDLFEKDLFQGLWQDRLNWYKLSI